MTELQRLIEELCPNGVEYKQLGEIEDDKLIKLGRGKVISKKDIRELPGDFPIYSSSSLNDGELGRYGRYMFDDERLSWSIDGGGRWFYRFSQKYSLTNVCGWLKVLDDSKLSTRYLYFVLTSEWSGKIFDYVHKAHPSVIRNEYKIPIPPLEVQKEIVRILDTFTELTSELTSELTARKKQYNYYRDELLSFGEEVEWKSLGEVVTIQRGKRLIKSQLSESGNFAVYQNSMVPLGYYDKSNVKSDTAFVISAGAAGEIGYSKVDFWAADDIYFFLAPDTINNKFLYYFLLTQQNKILAQVRRASIPRLPKMAIEKLKFPIPPLSEQERIVDILDRFDALCNDLSQGLPAEIEARKKQYEYYRDKLLDFRDVAKKENYER